MYISKFNKETVSITPNQCNQTNKPKDLLSNPDYDSYVLNNETADVITRFNSLYFEDQQFFKELIHSFGTSPIKNSKRVNIIKDITNALYF